MSNMTINQFTSVSTIDPVNDPILIWNNASSTTRSISRNSYLNLLSQPVGLSDSQTLTNKTLTNPSISSPTLSGTVSGTYTLGGTVTLPTSVATLTGTQTLTNKTLTSPTINSPNITNATITTDSVAGYTSSTSGSMYGISVTSAKISGASLTSATVPYGALTTDSSWAWQSYTPTLTGYSGTPTITVAKYTQIGKTVYLAISFTGTSNATTVTFTLPVTPKASPSFHATVTDNSTAQTSSGLIVFTASSTTASAYKTLASGAWTASGTLSVQSFGITYEAL